MVRNLQPRKQRGEHDIAAFNYPFSACVIEDNFEGNVEDLLATCCTIEQRHIPHLESPPPGLFPNNIKRWIWSSPGQNDGDSWCCIVELTPDESYEGERYLYFTAWCDYTGFDCQGGSYIITAKKVEHLIEFALENADYIRYMKETEPAEVSL